MFWVPNKLVFLTTPRCASRTISQALYEQADAVPLGHTYHPLDEAVRRAYEALDCPFWSILRDPVEQLLSYWWNSFGDPVMNILRDDGTAVPFDDYIPQWAMSDRWPRLNIYADWTDKFYLYDSGIAGFFAEAGLPHVSIDKPTDTIGTTVKTAVAPPNITSHTIEQMWKHYPQDMELWTSVTRMEHIA